MSPSEDLADEIFGDETPPPGDDFEYDAPGERTSGTFTARTHPDGAEVEIREKRMAADGNAVTVFVSVDGAEYVPNPEAPSDTIVRYDPELHAAGTPASGEAGAVFGPTTDATEAAETRAESEAELTADGVDATEAAEVMAEREAELTQSKEAPTNEIEAPEPSDEPVEDVEPEAIPPFSGGSGTTTEEPPPSEDEERTEATPED